MRCNKIGSFNGISVVVSNLRQHLYGAASTFLATTLAGRVGGSQADDSNFHREGISAL
jgi:hypothetical protein